MLKRWLRSLFQTISPESGRPRSATVRLALEALEPRQLLSATSAPAINLDVWAESNLRNASLQVLVDDRLTDQSIDRADMLAVFEHIKSDGVIRGDELRDVRRLVAAGAALQMPADVKNLASKVVNGNPANARYHGQVLGNLYAGASSSRLTNLVDKWFLGGDHPVARTAYEYVSAPLFVDGISFGDVRQGRAPDCWLLAGLAEIAARNPGIIQDMFSDNGDDTFTVRFFRGRVAEFVTVDKFLPDGYASVTHSDADGHWSDELWVPLAEKAYAQVSESGWNGRPRSNSYASLSYGYVSQAVRTITGQPALMWSQLSFTTVVNHWNAGAFLGFSSRYSAAALDVNGIVHGNGKRAGAHAYAVIDYDAATRRFEIFNPWGYDNGAAPARQWLTWRQIVQSFANWDGVAAR